MRRDRTEWREEDKGGGGEGALEVEWSAVTGSHPPAATGGLPCRGFSALACPELGEKLLPVDDSASLPPPFPLDLGIHDRLLGMMIEVQRWRI